MRSTMISAVEFADARWRLLKAEAGDASRSVLRAAALGSLALLAAGAAYAGMVIALTVWTARIWFDGDKLPAALAVTALNFMIAVVAGVTARRSLSVKTFFRASLKELKLDRQCIQNP